MQPLAPYLLFLDLDGVLADFDLGVERVTGRRPHELASRDLWRAVARARGFFAELPWTHDGRALWEATRALSPVVLTGLPMGGWAEAQKRAWCARELGVEVRVITCLAREKPSFARAHCEALRAAGGPALTPLLVDDRPKHQAAWEEMGGVWVTHTSAAESLAALRALGVLAP
ncbi:MAG: hypothetical protein FJ138_13670 [Deltaproteobacteria bacterium]|nr:hypothetical protein [Deltaproteobacteria bacterium]